MDTIIYFKEKADVKICLFSVLYITSLLANLTLGYRYINLYSFVQSGGIFIFPISFIISDIVIELYGGELGKKLVYYGIFCQFLFAAYAFFVVHTPAPKFLLNKEVYYQVFNPYLKFALASSSSILVGAWVNMVSLSKLSEYIGGKYFALRSFVASTLGELIVTFMSMFIANYNRMDIKTLLFMIGCCFTIKTIVSFFAVWPAAIVVYKLQDQKKYDLSFNLKQPFIFFKNLILAAWHAKGYVYTLESINLETKKVSLYFKGTRGFINLPIQAIVFNEHIINNVTPSDSAHLGYYYGVIESKTLLNEARSIEKMQILKKGDLNITAIGRDGRLTIETCHSEISLSKKPIELFNNRTMLQKFAPTQALYIGYLASISKHGSGHKKNNVQTFRIIRPKKSS